MKKIKQLEIVRLEEDDKLALTFHENTKLFFVDKFKSKHYPLIWKKIHFKVYSRFEKVNLPSNFKRKSELEKILLKRRSRREFNGNAISIKKLSRLLYFSCGISNKDKNWDESRRTYPSAGARYPLEVYIVVFNVENMKPGIYHYNVKEHTLELIKKGSFKRIFIKITNYQNWIKNASVLILISAVFRRTTIKYKNRGYRYVLFEAGHMAQNFYLEAENLNLKCCAIGGFLDDEVNELLELDGVNECIIYILAVGE